MQTPQVPETYDAKVLRRIIVALQKEIGDLRAELRIKEAKSLQNNLAARSLAEDIFYLVTDTNRINIDLAVKHNGRLHFWSSNTDGSVASTGGQAPADAQYVVSAADAALPNADVLTPTTNQIKITNGTNTNTVSFPTDTFLAHAWEDSGTNNMQNSLTIARNSSGTPAAAFGSAIELRLETNTTPNTRVAAIDVQHVVATHASRTARLRLVIADAGGDREVLRIESSGSAGLLSFFGGTAVAKQAAITQTYSTASATHANPTATTLTDNSGGTANTTLQALTDPADAPAAADNLRDDLVANLIPELRNNFADLAASNNALIVDVANAKQVLNTVIDYLQAYSLTS